MIQINQIKLPVEQSEQADLENAICELLHINSSNLYSVKILKRSIDARKKPKLFWVYQVAIKIHHETEVLRHCHRNRDIQLYKKPIHLMDRIETTNHKESVVIIGAGPAGLFAAYYVALSGAKPIILERGASVDERNEEIQKFWKQGVLNPQTNISFGEGGAGTFSDGKLNTGAKDKFGRIRFVLETFVECGANPDILYDAKPHIGTDVLQNVIKNLRKRIESFGGEFHFHTKAIAFKKDKNQITAITCQQDDKQWDIEASHCILAIGHSARDTFEYLYQSGVAMEPKAFAVGVRVEHCQEDIDQMQYGKSRENLPPADYKCTGKGIDDRGVYSFCMCPGGFVVNASSEEGGLVVNGMSNQARNEKNANSAIVVTVTPEDFPDDTPLGGVAYQRELEKRAFSLGNGKIPVQRLEDFKKNIATKQFGRVTPNTKGDTILTNMRNLFPEYINESLIMGMEQFGRRMKGFDDADTLFEGVETRTSSPVRILRNDELQATWQGLYPCGEGAGYAGGIMSAAMDGLRVAEQCIKQVR